jgi:hypothetical protein
MCDKSTNKATNGICNYGVFFVLFLHIITIMFYNFNINKHKTKLSQMLIKALTVFLCAKLFKRWVFLRTSNLTMRIFTLNNMTQIVLPKFII